VTEPQIYTLIVLAALGAIVCAWQVRRALCEPSERDRIVAEAQARTGLPPAAPDNVPGVDLFDLDACRRILHATDELEAGYARLWDAIHEARTEDQP
jgi:hypothetical protein